jgi:hypothetical protein
MLGNRGTADFEGAGEFPHGKLTAREAGKNRPARRIGQGGEGVTQAVGSHLYLTLLLINSKAIYIAWRLVK